MPICRSWFHPVTIENHTLRLVLPLNCTVAFFIGKGDQHYFETSVFLIYNMSIPILTDYFTIRCQENDITDSTKRQIQPRQYPVQPRVSIRYDSIVRQRLENYTLQTKKNTTVDEYNVLILGVDSVSRLHFERLMPKTYRYLTHELNGIVLKGYNVLGDGTPQQVIPMLTGYKEQELPSTLLRIKNSSFVDVYPFIWKDFERNGYVTAYAEDRMEYGTYTLRLRGFKNNPTDHYMPPFYLMKSTMALLYKKTTHCVGSETPLELFLSYLKTFWKSYENNKKFYFGFFKMYTHDNYNMGQIGDNDLYKLLKHLRDTGELEKTIVSLMTDHGSRASDIRSTPQGKLEERLPFMSFILPSQFRQKYPHAYKALKANVDRFTTPFDIYATLKSLLNMKNLGNQGQIKQRSISLFDYVPVERTCDDINLEPHWCSCLEWKPVDITDELVQTAVKHIVEYINEILLEANSLCQRLYLDGVENVVMHKPNTALVTFSGSRDKDGRVPHYDIRNAVNSIMFYQITFKTKPNQAVYEATTQYLIKSKKFTTDYEHISRINRYESQAHCVEQTLSHLRKFCYCVS
ncbi:unnamed protein product [Didymodactylos carnosus]|uniref:Uncharacterized protein n=2 Tax=Didymodactylos carnosus TaxID=1234261 RepID=A0A814GMC6_9BILA|nr:unnamed protein product [Didymodactylos carnosus]CAF3769843.1 unnamed protein product [Didymodactylos carnosus]